MEEQTQINKTQRFVFENTDKLVKERSMYVNSNAKTWKFQRKISFHIMSF